VIAGKIRSRAQAYLKDIGVDWLTLTTKNPDRAQDWHEAFNAVATQEQQRGHRWGDARFFGYVGQACGHIFYGKRHDGALLRLSSSLAESVGALFSPDACHCTRIDLQVTCELATAQPDMLERLYDSCTSGLRKVGRPVEYSLIKNSNGARTLYVGRRSSQRYGRVYDKGMEQGQGEPGKLIRFELEVKDEMADQAVAMIYRSGEADTVILRLLQDFFEERGIPVLWNAAQMEVGFRGPRLAIDDASSLRWIGGPVAKTVARLMHSVGPERTVRAIFGLLLDNSSDSDMIDLLALECARVYDEWAQTYSPTTGG
jgi:DNA relaxase NicK